MAFRTRHLRMWIGAVLLFSVFSCGAQTSAPPAAVPVRPANPPARVEAPSGSTEKASGTVRDRTAAPATGSVIENALSATELGLQTLPAPARALVDDGYLELRVGNRESAIQSFRKAAELVPDHPGIFFGLGTAFLAAEKYGEALENLEEALKRSPGNSFVMNNIAWIYATSKDPRYSDGQKAVRIAREALLITPASPFIWSTLAEAYYFNGDYEKAARAAREALRLIKTAGATGPRLEEYEELSARCEAAVSAMDILQ